MLEEQVSKENSVSNTDPRNTKGVREDRGEAPDGRQGEVVDRHKPR